MGQADAQCPAPPETMKILLFTAVAALFLGMAGNGRAADPEVRRDKPALRHVVAFKFKADAKQERIDSVVKAFAALPGKIREIARFEWGTNNSPEGHNKGCTHCFTLTFHSEKDRDIYLPHPAHKEFVALVGPLVEDVFVIDYWVK